MGIFSKREPVEVYCQSCGEELTESGGMVSSSGNIYCRGYRNNPNILCQDEAIFNGIEGGIVFSNYRTPREVQKDIKKGVLKNFGPLENLTDSK